MNRIRDATPLFGARPLIGLAALVAAGALPVASLAESRPDPISRAYLFGAAFASSDLSTDKSGGMMFLPGRGLVRWETRGKSIEEQEELKTEAIGLADARAVQAEIDAREALMAAERNKADEAMARRQEARFAADSRTVPALNLSGASGTDSKAGAIAPLNRAALRASGLAGALGVRDGSSFKSKSRFYVFGAVSGRGVGMNLMHDDNEGWRNGGLSTDKGGFIGQRQAGIAIRKGPAQAALSYVQEKTRANILGITSIKDHRAMITLSLVPPLIH